MINFLVKLVISFNKSTHILSVEIKMIIVKIEFNI